MEIQIPIDVFESPTEILIIMPLGGVQRKSIDLFFEEYKLIISGVRKMPELRDDFLPLSQECFRGSFTQKIDLPPNIYFDRIHSKLTEENVLHIVVPKVLQPEKIKLEIEYL